MSEKTSKYHLPLDKEYVNSLDLPTLAKMLPLYESKHKEVIHCLEQVETERTGLEQTLSRVEFEKCKLEKLFANKKQAYQEVALREKNVQIELSRMRLMCPIYELQMDHLLQQEVLELPEASKAAASKFVKILPPNQNPITQTDNELIDSTTVANWSTVEENLNEQRELLVVSMIEKQKYIDHFVNKYLD